MKKSKRYVRICAALLCAVLCLSVNVAPAMAAKVTQADIDALKGNAASLDKKQKEIQSKLNSLKNDKAAACRMRKATSTWSAGNPIFLPITVRLWTGERLLHPSLCYTKGQNQETKIKRQKEKRR